MKQRIEIQLMKKQLWLAITAFLLPIILLTGCAGLGFEPEKEAKEPINRAEWPTPIPARPVASPTPFPKVELPPTATPTPRPTVANEQPASVSPTAATSMNNLLDTITAQTGPLAGWGCGTSTWDLRG